MIVGLVAGFLATSAAVASAHLASHGGQGGQNVKFMSCQAGLAAAGARASAPTAVSLQGVPPGGVSHALPPAAVTAPGTGVPSTTLPVSSAAQRLVRAAGPRAATAPLPPGGLAPRVPAAAKGCGNAAHVPAGR